MAVAARAAVHARLHEAMPVEVEGPSAWSTATRVTMPPLVQRRVVEDGDVDVASTPSVRPRGLAGLATASPLWLAARLAVRQRTRS